MQVNSSELKINTIAENGNTGVFSFEPLPKGFGNTLGNTLRRVLLTSIQGAAVTQLKISGVDHQFTTVPGVKEDVVEISLNFKKIRVKMHSTDPIVATINKKGPGAVTAGDIEVSSEAEILNKDLQLLTLSDKNATFKAELIIESGVGYSPMEERQTQKIGVIVLDAFFSPVINAVYQVEPTRAGKVIDLDKLVINIETDGGINPTAAIIQSSGILRDFFEKIMAWAPQEDETAIKSNALQSKLTVSENVSVDELPLPTRTINALKKQGIETLAQLSEKTNEDLSDIKNLGEKSVKEIKKLLKREG